MPKLPDTRAPALRPRPAPARPATGSGVRWLLTASLIATLGACANYSGIDPSARAVDASPLGLDNTPQKYQGNDWWLALNDAQLTALIQQAIEHSPGLKATRARLALTESLLDQRKAQDGPQLGVELDLQRQLFTANSIYPPPFGGSIYEMGTLQLDASWELDFFGKNSAALAASLGQLRAVEADLQAARGLIAANVARSYYQLVRLQAQRKLAQQTLELREKMQKLVGQRVLAGLDTRLELVQSHGALPQVQLQIEQLDEQKALAMNALAALTAQPVQALALFYDFREQTPIGADGDEMVRRLARRLIDVDLLDQAAELLKHQVDERLEGVAKAQVATDLATVYLMDRQAEKALQVIWASRSVFDAPASVP